MGSIVAALVALTLAVVFFLRLNRRRTGTKRAKGTPAQRRTNQHATLLVKTFDKHLARLGYPRSPMTTPLEHLDNIKGNASFPLEHAYEIVQRYNEVRFGLGAFGNGELRSLVAAIKRIGPRS
jgi:hypothetical protein